MRASSSSSSAMPRSSPGRRQSERLAAGATPRSPPPPPPRPRERRTVRARTGAKAAALAGDASRRRRPATPAKSAAVADAAPPRAAGRAAWRSRRRRASRSSRRICSERTEPAHESFVASPERTLGSDEMHRPTREGRQSRVGPGRVTTPPRGRRRRTLLARGAARWEAASKPWNPRFSQAAGDVGEHDAVLGEVGRVSCSMTNPRVPGERDATRGFRPRGIALWRSQSGSGSRRRGPAARRRGRGSRPAQIDAALGHAAGRGSPPAPEATTPPPPPPPSPPTAPAAAGLAGGWRTHASSGRPAARPRRRRPAVAAGAAEGRSPLAAPGRCARRQAVATPPPDGGPADRRFCPALRGEVPRRRRLLLVENGVRPPVFWLGSRAGADDGAGRAPSPIGRSLAHRHRCSAVSTSRGGWTSLHPSRASRSTPCSEASRRAAPPAASSGAGDRGLLVPAATCAAVLDV